MRFEVRREDAGTRLDKLLCARIEGLGRASVKKLFSLGRIRVVSETGARHRAAKGDVVREGMVVEVELEATDNAAVADPSIALDVVLETEQLVVVDKPAGQPTAPLEPGELGSLANALVARYPEMRSCGFSPREPGLCHRLDTDTSGLVLAARTQPAFAALTTALREGRLDKRYLLLTRSADLPEQGTIEIPIAPHPKDRKRVLACAHPRDVARNAPRPAFTEYTKLREHDGLALVEVHAPKALRHQIRAHFAAIGHPLLGDALYGGEPWPGLCRHALHAHAIRWSGDATVPAFTVQSPLPRDLAAILGETD
jgi:23S rRNA pseudouridine1911/1915/1917 synthase